MKTAVAWTSIDAYYQSIVQTGAEVRDAHALMAHVLKHWPCTRREIAAHFRALDPKHRFAQEARISARINWLLKFEIDGRRVLSEGTEVVDPGTGHKAKPLYPTGIGLQRDLFSPKTPYLTEVRA